MKKVASKLFRVPYGVFLALVIISALLAVFAMRANNQKMVELRSAVYTADEKGGDVNMALNSLQNYVHAHMNTDLSSGGNTIKPPIQLKHTYERLKLAEDQRVKEANSNLYSRAQSYCQIQAPAPATSRVPCVDNYVASHNATAKTIAPALYQFDFISPSWSPDLAGWSIVVGGLMFIMALLAFVKQELAT